MKLHNGTKTRLPPRMLCWRDLIYYCYVKTKMLGFFQTSFYFGFTLIFSLGLGVLVLVVCIFVDTMWVVLDGTAREGGVESYFQETLQSEKL